MRGRAGVRSIGRSSPRRAIGSDIRIALVHSFYSSRQPSGENNVVEAELCSLRSAGHEVRLVAARTDDLEGERTNQVRSALRVASGAGRSPREELEDFEPDVVHVHNLFPNFGRRWVDALDIPIVHTLHNYRPLCANGQLLRDGRICTLCPDGDRWAGVRHGCYRDSRLATLPISWANRRGPVADWLLARADRLIVLSELQREFFRSSGTPSERMTIWPNFLPTDLDPGPGAGAGGDEWLFVGRLFEQKGIVRLVEQWPVHARLRVVGDGPERERLVAAAGENVEVLGARQRHEIIELMRASAGLVLPSLGYESSATPLVYVEALAAGLPVVALPPSPVVESVRDDGTGVVLSWDDDLGAALAGAAEQLHGLRGRCREVFEARHTEAAYLRRAQETYEQVIGERSVRRNRDDASPAVTVAVTADRAVGGVLEDEMYKTFPPRWSHIRVPTSSRGAAVSGLMLYSPCRTGGRLLRTAAWYAVRVGGPWMLPGPAGAWTPPVEGGEWEELVARWRLELGPFDTLAAYAPPQAARTGGAFLLIRDGRPLAFVKLRRPTRRPANGPPALELLEQTPPEAFWAPRLLAAGDSSTSSWVALSTFPLHPHRPARRPPLARVVRDVQRALAGLPRSADVPVHWRPMHGDLAPWNLRVAHRRGLVLLDWEDAGWGPPGADATYFAAVAAALWGHRPPPAPPEAASFWREKLRGRVSESKDEQLSYDLDRALADMGRRGTGAGRS